MITLPPQFAATRFPGYFWNVDTQTLYTAKLGVLREMRRDRPSYFNHMFDGYRVSVNGKRKCLNIEYLRSLTRADSVFPLEEPK